MGWVHLRVAAGSTHRFALLFVGVFFVSIAYFAFALPSISFEPPTLNDSATTGANWVFVNVTSSEPLNQSLLEWGNQSGYFNFTMLNSSSTNWFLNVSNLADGAYNYTVWVHNITGAWNQSQRMFVAVDTIQPSIVFVYPTPDTGNITSNNWVYINITVSDASDTTAFIDWNRSLVGWWRYNDESGENSTFFRDWSTYGNNGTCSGATCPSSAQGMFGKALIFNASGNTVITIPVTNELKPQDFTIQYWIKATDFTNGGVFGVSTNTILGAYSIGNGGYTFTIGGTYINAAYSHQVNQWYFYTITKENKNVTIYVNGVVIKEYILSSSFIDYAGITKWYVGSWASSSYDHNGVIDEFRIFNNNVLTPIEVNASYNAGVYRLYNNFTELKDNEVVGDYTYKAYIQDLAGNINQTEARTLSVNLTPEIFVLSPVNGTSYSSSPVWANITFTKPASWCGVSLNGASDQTMSNATVDAWYLSLPVPSEGQNNVTFFCNTTSDQMVDSTTTYFTLNYVPQAVTNLQNQSSGDSWIYWNWTNPTDPDFNHSEVWLSGYFAGITQGNWWNATPLPRNATYQLQVRTVDNSGNVNLTWVNSSATTTGLGYIGGTLPNPYGSTNITGNTTWRDNFVYIGYYGDNATILLLQNSKLDLINTTLVLNASYDGQKMMEFLYMTTGYENLTVTNSTVQGTNKSRAPAIYLNSRIASMIAKNSAFTNIYQIKSFEANTFSFTDNIFDGYWQALFIRALGKEGSVRRNTFLTSRCLGDTGGCAGIVSSDNLWYPAVAEWLDVRDNVFDGSNAVPLYGEIDYTNAFEPSEGTYLYYVNNTCKKENDYAINLWSGKDGFSYVAKGYLEDCNKAVVLNKNERDNLVEYITLNKTNMSDTENYLGGVVSNLNNYNNTIRHISGISGGGIGVNLYYGANISDNYWYAISLLSFRPYEAGISLAGTSDVYENISITKHPADTTNAPGIKAVLTNIENAHAENITLRNMDIASYSYGVWLNSSVGLKFIDLKLSGVKLYDVYFDGNNSGIIFINPKFNQTLPVVYFGNNKDIFQPYWYLDVAVNDAQSNPIPNISLIISNEVNVSVQPINLLGTQKNTFATSSDGHVPASRNIDKETYSSYFNLSNSTQTIFGGWIKTTDRAQVILYEYDAEHNLVYPTLLWSNNSTWNEKRVMFTTASSTKYGRVMLDVKPYENVTVWFDDLYVNQSGMNLLNNSGFESGDTNWVPQEGWRWTVDSGENHSGSRSYKMTWHFFGQNDYETPVLQEYAKTNTTWVNYTYTVLAYDPSGIWTNITHTIYPNGTIQQLQPLAQVTGVNPNESWYRPDPNVPTYTVNLTTNYTRTNLSVNANQNATNITVTRWNTSLPPGQILVNFTAESVDGNNVNFTVCSLVASTNYVVKNDGNLFTNKTADSSGCIWFNNSVWTAHVFTVEVQSSNLFPWYLNAGTTATLAGSNATFYAFWHSDAGLSGFIFSTNMSGTWQNSSWVPMAGTGNWSLTTMQLPDAVGTIVGYRFYANNTISQWNDTGVLSVKTTAVELEGNDWYYNPHYPDIFGMEHKHTGSDMPKGVKLYGNNTSIRYELTSPVTGNATAVGLYICGVNGTPPNYRIRLENYDGSYAWTGSQNSSFAITSGGSDSDSACISTNPWVQVHLANPGTILKGAKYYLNVTPVNGGGNSSNYAKFRWVGTVGAVYSDRNDRMWINGVPSQRSIGYFSVNGGYYGQIHDNGAYNGIDAIQYNITVPEDIWINKLEIIFASANATVDYQIYENNNYLIANGSYPPPNSGTWHAITIAPPVKLRFGRSYNLNIKAVPRANESIGPNDVLWTASAKKSFENYTWQGKNSYEPVLTDSSTTYDLFFKLTTTSVSGSGDVVGYILDQSASPINNATVDLFLSNGTVYRSIATDSTGYYFFHDIWNETQVYLRAKKTDFHGYLDVQSPNFTVLNSIENILNFTLNDTGWWNDGLESKDAISSSTSFYVNGGTVSLPPNQILVDNFTGTDAARLNVHNASWSYAIGYDLRTISNQVELYVASNVCAVRTDFLHTSYSTLKVNLSSASAAGLMFHAKNYTNGYVIRYDYVPNPDRIRLSKIVNGAITDLANVSVSYQAGATLLVNISGQKFDVYYNDSVLTTFYGDGTYTDGMPGVCFFSQAYASMDDFNVTSGMYPNATMESINITPVRIVAWKEAKINATASDESKVVYAVKSMEGTVIKSFNITSNGSKSFSIADINLSLYPSLKVGISLFNQSEVYGYGLTWGTETATVNITAYYNNASGLNNPSVYSLHNAPIFFNVTANQAIDTWWWYKDGMAQSRNANNITLNWSDSGIYVVQVNGTNSNGTTQTVQWNVTVEYGEITITSPVVWTNQVRTHAGTINIRPGGHLTLDNTTIIFNQKNSSGGADMMNYIMVYAPSDASTSTIITKNNTLITVSNTSTMWTGMHIHGGHANFTDTTFIRFSGAGRGCGVCHGGGGGGIAMWGTGAGDIKSSNFENVTFIDFGYTGFYGAISTQNIYEPVNIRNSKFYGNEKNFNDSGGRDDLTGVYYIEPATYNKVNAGVVENNIFMHINRPFMVNYALNITLRNNTVYNYIAGLDFFNNVKNSLYSYNNFSAIGALYSTMGCNIGCSDNIYEYNTLYGNNIVNVGTHFNYGSTNITIRNNILGGFASASVSKGLNQRYFQVYNNTVIGLGANGYQIAYNLAAADSSIHDNVFKNMWGGSSICINQKMAGWPDDTVDPNAGNWFPSNNTFTNNICENMYYGFTLFGTTEVRIIDQKMVNVSNSHVRLYGDNHNLKFINSQINSSRIYFNNTHDSFDNYYYLDLLVQNSDGDPVSGATVAISNTVNSAYPSINRNGDNKTAFATGAGGHTPMPIGNDSETAILMDFWKTSSTQQDMAYAISAYDTNNIWTNVTHTVYPNGTIQQLQPLAQVTGVNPDESWYRQNPNTYQNTTTLQINYLKTDISLAVTNAANLTVLEYSPSKINFTTVNSTSSQRMNLTVSNGTFPVLSGYPYALKTDGVLQSTQMASANQVVFSNISVEGWYLVELFTNLTVFLHTPSDNLLTNNPLLAFNCSAFSNNSLMNLTLYGDFSGGFVQNGSVDVSGGVNETVFVRTLLDGSYVWNCLASDNTGTAFASDNYSLTVDTAPPGSITNLLNQSQSTDWIFWNWTNPFSDFGHVEVYLNGTWKTNTSNSSYTATGLNASTWYQLSVRTVDVAGNVNGAWVNSSARTLDDTTPPTITILLPANTTYNYNWSLPLNFSVSEPASWCGYSLDGAQNVTILSCFNTTFNVSSSVAHSLRIYANDTAGNMNSGVVYFTVDIAAPVISNISSSAIISSSATIVWTTDELGDSTVFYGATVTLGSNKTNASLTSAHAVLLDGLSSSMQYYYNVSSCDGVGNCNSSTQFSFSTSASPTTPPGSPPSGGSQPAVVSSRTKSVVVKSPVVRVVVALRSELSNPSLVVTLPPAVPVVSPSGLVYHYLNVTKINFNNSDIANASIEFRVNKSWITEESIKQVYLSRYSNGWTKLRTELVSSTSTQNSYRAYTSGFSYFAIVGEQAVSSQVDIPHLVNESPVVVVKNQFVPAPVLVAQQDIDDAVSYLNSVAPQTQNAKQILGEARLKIDEAQTAFNRDDHGLAKDLLVKAQTLIKEASGLRPAMVDKSGLYSILLVFVAVLLGAYAHYSRPQK